MESYAKFFQALKKLSSGPHPVRDENTDLRAGNGFVSLEIIEIVRGRQCYYIHARIPGSPRTFKFSLLKDGRVFGFCHDEELPLTELTQKILREKFALYVQDCPSYFISE